MTSITPYFPTTSTITSPRLQQEYLFDEITMLFEAGESKIVVCAPTGIGKSILATALLRWNANQGNTGLITSPLNELVDQYDKDFGVDYLATIKGRKHYACNADYTRSCAEGFCQEKSCSVDQSQTRYCMNIATINLCPDENKEQCECFKCIYKSKMKAYKNSSKGNTNFTLFQKNVTNEPSLIILDECDSVESFVRMAFTVSVPEVIEWDDFEDHIISLLDWKDHYKKVSEDVKYNLERTKNPVQKLSLSKDLKRAERRCLNINRIINDYETHEEPWAVTNDLNVGSTKYEPITTNRFLEPLLNNRMVIQMSATPQSLPDYYPIEVDSPFPPEIRGWKFNPIGKMSLKHRDKTIPKLAKFLCGLQGKTLVHCISYRTAEAIGKEIINVCGETPLIQIGKENQFSYSNGNGTVTRKDAVAKFKESNNPNQILLSVKMDTGVDFPEPNILNNIIAVLPFPNPYDPLTIAKDNLLGKSWQGEHIARTVTQMLGRINRNDKKTTLTQIVASEWSWWFKRNKHHFKKHFLEAQL